jgi:hypothetical protein
MLSLFLLPPPTIAARKRPSAMASTVHRRRPSLKEFDAKQLEIKDRTAEILKEKMDWADLSRSGTITDAERGLLQDFLLSYKDKDAASKWDFLSEKVRSSLVISLASVSCSPCPSQGDVLAKLFAKILKTSHRDEVAHYVLVCERSVSVSLPPSPPLPLSLACARPRICRPSSATFWSSTRRTPSTTAL